MWDKLFEYGKQILSLTKRVDENTSDIKELRASLKELTSTVVDLAQSNNELKILFEHLKETEGSARDKLTREWQIYQGQPGRNSCFSGKKLSELEFP